MHMVNKVLPAHVFRDQVHHQVHQGDVRTGLPCCTFGNTHIKVVRQEAAGWADGDVAQGRGLTGCSWAANSAGAVAMPLARSLSAGLPSMLLLPV